MLREVSRHFPLTWRMSRPYRLPSSQQGEPYYLSWFPGGGPFGERWTRAQFDRNGVIRLGSFYNPVTVANFALHNYELLCDGLESARASFLAQAQYFLRAQREDGAFPYEFASPRYGAQSGWLSAMAQGMAASVLLRAHALTAEPKYREAALRAARPLALDISKGGVSFIRDGAVFFEEIASADPVHILNGHLCAAFAVWELTEHKIAPFLNDLHAAAVGTLERWLPNYDADGWSYYQLATRQGERHYAPLFYHQIHVAQLHVYHAMTKRRSFMEMSVKWRNAMDDPHVRARVWLDSIGWLFKGLLRRTRGAPVPVWSSIKP